MSMRLPLIGGHYAEKFHVPIDKVGETIDNNTYFEWRQHLIMELVMIARDLRWTNRNANFFHEWGHAEIRFIFFFHYVQSEIFETS